MKKQHIIGIDVSKLTLDCHRYGSSSGVLTISNSITGFKMFLKWIQTEVNKKVDTVFVVMEHTGYYTHEFEKFLYKKNIAYCKKPALDIKRSCGMIRGKNDKADARMISKYGFMRKEELVAHTPISATQLELQQLMNYRDKLVADKASYQTRNKEMAKQLNKEFNKSVKASSIKIVELIKEELKTIESKIEELVGKEATLTQNYCLAKSVVGVGFAVAIHIIIATENFTKFENHRQFACYCGVAPFEYSSGTSIKGKTKTSKLANRKIKSLLTMAAISAIQHDVELRAKYQQKVKEGKPKMSALNMIRAKLIERIFTVIKRQTQYEVRLAA
jgi:transposase